MPERAAQIIGQHFDGWFEDFRVSAARHRAQFAQQDWQGIAATSAERLQLYGRRLRRCLGELKRHLGDRATDRDTWARIRGRHSLLRAGHPNVELAETFFNSNARRLLRTVGVDPHVEYVGSALTEPRAMEAEEAFASFEPREGTASMVRRVLQSFDLGVEWEDAGRDAHRVAHRLDEAVSSLGARVGRLDVLRPAFFRNKGAYLIGRLVAGDAVLPVILPVLHARAGRLRVDPAHRAVLAGDAGAPESTGAGRPLPLPAGEAVPGLGAALHPGFFRQAQSFPGRFEGGFSPGAARSSGDRCRGSARTSR